MHDIWIVLLVIIATGAISFRVYWNLRRQRRMQDEQNIPK
jgi:Flp pilus assembly protein TadB